MQKKNNNKKKFTHFNERTKRLRTSITDKNTYPSQLILFKALTNPTWLYFLKQFFKNYVTSQFQIQTLSFQII